MKYVRSLLLLTLASPFAYVGSYLLNVTAPVAEAAYTGHQVVPHYRFGGKVAEQVFAPVHILDTRLRTQYWHVR